jgi:hypothetical protein
MYTNIRAQQRINLTCRIDNQIKIRKELNTNSVNQQTSKMKREIITYASITVPNVNSLSFPIKRYRLAK